ncbi:hypothetical protein AAK967_05510 [Atopobiaceae bacterium 24-176]
MLLQNGSIHEQTTSADINFVVSGRGHAPCDGVREEFAPSVCHVCPKALATPSSTTARRTSSSGRSWSEETQRP